LAKSKSYIDWRKVKGVHDELLDQRVAILERVAPHDVGAALSLMWQFTDLAGPLLDRTYDIGGTLVRMFQESLPLFADLATHAKPPPGLLAAQIKDALLANRHSTYNGLIAHLAPALSDDGLLILTEMMQDALKDEAPKGEGARRARICRQALQDIADARGDVDAFIASFSNAQARTHDGAAQIAKRLLRANRAGDARERLEASKSPEGKPTALWQGIYAQTLEALDQKEAAQKFRLTCFHQNLNADLLRAYIKRLPDFDDEEALDAALLYARHFPDFNQALAFLLAWPSLKHAAARIIQDHRALDGNDFAGLNDLIDALGDNHALATTLVRRALVEDTLTNFRTKRYRHAARHIAACGALAPHISDWQGHEDHQTWLRPLLKDQPYKLSRYTTDL
jgi:hypothetical protein